MKKISTNQRAPSSPTSKLYKDGKYTDDTVRGMKRTGRCGDCNCKK